MAKSEDCSDALAQIECRRRSQEALGKPIESRLIAWGLEAIARETPGANPRQGWEKLSQEQRWRRVRASLSASALIALQGVLERRYGAGAEQMSILEDR